MQRIKFYKTFSTSNLLILGVVLLAMGFSSYKILFSETEDVSTYVIINSLVSVLPIIIYSYRKQKAHWVQYDQKRKYNARTCEYDAHCVSTMPLRNDPVMTA